MHGMLIGACDPMLCPIHVFRPPTAAGPHHSVGLRSATWDMIATDIGAGKGVRGMSGEKQGYAHWYWFRNPGNATWGELTFWNDLQDFVRHTSTTV